MGIKKGSRVEGELKRVPKMPKVKKRYRVQGSRCTEKIEDYHQPGWDGLVEIIITRPAK
jgi:hypothetical protein